MTAATQTEEAVVDYESERTPEEAYQFTQKYKENLPVRLGELTDKNVEQLKTLNRSIFPVKYNDKFYTDVQQSGTYTKLAYYSTDILVGAISCRVEKPPAVQGSGAGVGGTKLYIMTVGVLAPYRSCGVGTKLLEATLNEAQKDTHLSEAYLHVQTSNEDAINFYSRFGFEIKGTIKNYYKRIDPPDCHVLVKSFSR